MMGHDILTNVLLVSVPQKFYFIAIVHVLPNLGKKLCNLMSHAIMSDDSLSKSFEV